MARAALARVVSASKRSTGTILRAGIEATPKSDSKTAGEGARATWSTLDSLWDSRVWIARGQTADAGVRAGAELPRHCAVAS